MASAPRAHETRPMAAGHVIVVVAVALLAGGVFNAQALTDAAARQPFGWKRTVAVVAATPFRGVAGLLGLDRPHEILASAAADATGQDAGGISPSEPPERREEPDPSPDDAEVASQVDPTEPAPESRDPENAASEAATEAATQRRAATRRQPLRVWVGGDSLTSEFGPALADTVARTRRGETEVDFRFSSGLARPDFFDWPAHFGDITSELNPDVFVVMFGANDGQNIAVKGAVLEFGSPEWEKEYSKRVDAVMDILGADGRMVLWVGQPIMRSPDFDAKMQALNEIYAARAEQHDGVTFVESRSVFAGPDGAYSAYLEDAEGQRTLMRQQDGIHLTRAGGERLTAVIFTMIDEEWRLTQRPSTPADG